MTQRDSNFVAPARSLPLRPRPRPPHSTHHPPPPASHPHHDGSYTGNEELKHESWDSSVDIYDDDNNNDQVLEEMSHFPDPVPRPRGAKSFSSLRHPVDGLRALGRRLSVSIRRHTHHAPHDDAHADHHKAHTHTHTRHAHGGSWDARARNSLFKANSINRRLSLHSPSALHDFYAPTGSIATPIPGNGLEPPVIPDDIYSGAAARAAAAVQNEMSKVAERDSVKIFDMRFPRDSESGIGIDLRDRSEFSDTEPSMLRIGKELSKETTVGSCPLTRYRSGCVPTGRNHGTGSVVSGPPITHEFRAGFSFLACAGMLPSYLEACFPSSVWVSSIQGLSYEKESVCWFRKNSAQSRLEENIPRSPGVGPAVEGRQGCCHLFTRAQR